MTLCFPLLATSFFAIANGLGNFLPNLIRRGDSSRYHQGSSGRISPGGLNRGPFWLASIASKAITDEDASPVTPSGQPSGQSSGHGSGTCSQPCQRVPHLIKFQHALIMNGVEFEIGSMMTSKNVDENGYIDVGRCAGSCRKVESQLIRVSFHQSYHFLYLPSPWFTLTLGHPHPYLTLSF